MHIRMKQFLVIAAIVMGGSASAQTNLEISLAHQSAPEARTREQLQRLLGSYDVAPWTFTKSIAIDETVIPHSHPVLTLSTRHLKDDELLLSTFVHEQLHWFLVQKGGDTRAAIADLRKIFPNGPAGAPEGAIDENSTYLHLIDCYLEYQADIRLLGELKARQVMEFWATDHYTWVYRTVLDRMRDIAAVVRSHNLIPGDGTAARQAPRARLQIDFEPANESFAAAAKEYAEIWASDGARIVSAMERATGLPFERGPIRANVLEAPSNSGSGDTPMRLRASYPAATKRAALVHELGHRLMGDLVPGNIDEHSIIFLFVYDVWAELWGQPFADEQVVIERRRTGTDYDGLWRAALTWSREERARRFADFVREHRK